MKYKEIHKNVFTMGDDYHLAHCIASDFGMGAGIAVQFQKKYSLRNKLKIHSKDWDTSPGTCCLIGKVFNLITKSRSYGKPTYASLESSLFNMKSIIDQFNEISFGSDKISKIAMPKIGCGLDRLQWGKVKEMIHIIFGEDDIEIVVCNWK